MEETTALYKAFISYRHLPLDRAVAVRLQTLLEGYRPPKGLSGRRIGRIFRDQSELPTSGDLSADICKALRQSEYLIVVCGSRTKESVWCMEEIRQFKELHDGRTDHILVLLAEGEPGEVFPEELLHERRWEGGAALVRSVEPLCSDVRADSVRRSLRLLKTEFLRIAAPLLGCSFDDLYRRQQRRKRKRIACAAAAGFSLLSCVLAVVSVFAYRTYLSEKNYRSMLAETYTRQGAQRTDDPQEALLYYASALALEPETQTAARTGASLLLECNVWPVLERREAGGMLHGVVCPGGYPYALAYARDGRSLIGTLDGYFIRDESGNQQELPEELGEFLGASASGETWVFCGGSEISFYDPAGGETRAIPRPTELGSRCEADAEALPSALPAAGGRAVTTYGGYVYLYEPGARTETVRVDLADVFPDETGQLELDAGGRLWISEDGELAVVSNGFGIAAFDTENLNLKAVCMRYVYLLNDVAFSADGSRFALVYGNSFGTATGGSGGYAEIFDRDGELLMQTPLDPETPLTGAAFDPEDPDKLLLWDAASVHFWEIGNAREYALPLRAGAVESASYASPEHCVVCDGKTLRYYNLTAFETARTAAFTPSWTPVEEVPDEVQAFALRDGSRLSHSYTKLLLTDENGAELDSLRLEQIVNRMVSAGNDEFYLFSKWGDVLYRISQPSGAKKLGELEQLDTRGQLLTALFPLEDCVAAVTGTNQLLLYYPDSAAPRKCLQLEHYGEVRELWQTDAQSLAVRIHVAENLTDYHFNSTDVAELWDFGAGLHIADFEGGALQIPAVPVPDETTVAFLTGLTCCAFDESQNITVRDPGAAASLGSWDAALSVLPRFQPEAGGAPEEKTAPDTALSLGELVAEYQNGPDGNDEAWFASFDEIWERLAREEIAFTAVDLDNWFTLYIENANSLGKLDGIGAGLDVYLRLTIEKSAGEEDWLSSVDSKLMDLMTLTGRYDRKISDFFLRFAAALEENLDPGSDNLDLERYSAYVLRCYGNLLAGGFTEDSFSEVNALQEQSELLRGLILDDDVLELLCRGDGKGAAELTGNQIQFMVADDSDYDTMAYFLKATLLSGYAFSQRGVIAPGTYDEYLGFLPADIGLRVTELSPEAQKQGLRRDDLIVSVSGVRIGCLAQAGELLDAAGDKTLKILRDGRIVSLDKKERAPFGAEFTVSIRKGARA